MNIICGIYKVTNIINNKIYIGQSVNIYDRWIKHQSPSHNNDGTAFHNALIKYGVNNFIWEIIEVCKQEELNQKEKYWIEYYNSYEKGYNETRGGDGIIKYDYKQIYQLWLSGLNCKEIANELKCDDSVITRALASYNLTEEELRSRSQQKRKIVAIDIKTGKGLKIFDSLRAAWLYFNPSIIGIGHLSKSINKKYKVNGYYFEDLSSSNIPNKELTDEEFFSYQETKGRTYNDKQREEISLRNRTVERPTREKLKQLIRVNSFVSIGKIYGVSNTSIIKWCLYYKLPHKKSEIKKYSEEEWNLI